MVWANFFDIRGGNVLPNSLQTTSENPSLFNATFYFLFEQADACSVMQLALGFPELKKLNRAKWETNGGKYMTNSYDNHDSFSLDEAIGVAATSRRYKHFENLKKISLFTRSYSLRPDTFSFLLLCKYPVFNLFLIPRIFVSLSMIISCMRKKSDTSGKQLAYVRYRGLNMNLTWFFCKLFLTNENFQEVFSIYFPEHDHPINQLARKIKF